MIDWTIVGLVVLLIESLRATGRWTLSLGGWKATGAEEAFLGFMVWLLMLVLAAALFAHWV